MRCLELWFQSRRVIAMLPRIGLDASVTIVPFGLTGTNDKSFCAAGLRQPEEIRLPATQGAPLTGSRKGLPVSGLVGSVRLVVMAVKSPVRSAALGTKFCE